MSAERNAVRRGSALRPDPGYFLKLAKFSWRPIGGKKASSESFSSCEKPLAAVNIEFNSTLISHLQQEGLASFLVRNIGSSHDLMNLERLFAQSAQNIGSIVQHAFSLTNTALGALLTIRELIFRDDSLYLVRFNTVPKTSVRLDRHALHDSVNLGHFDLHPSLRPLTAMTHFIVELVSV